MIFSTLFPPKPNFVSHLLSIVTAQLQQMNLKATYEAGFDMHTYFNAFKQRILLRSNHKARKKKPDLLKSIGIVLVLELYWYC
jgi:hypothetical protein